MERVVVVGAGIVGASAAYRLACAGVRVTLVDRADPGQATAAGAGIVSAATTASVPPGWLPLAAAAIAFYPELVDRLREDGQADTGYEAVGGLFVAADERERAGLDAVERLVLERRAAGMGNIGEVSRAGPAEAARLFPPIAPGAEGIHMSGGARVDGRGIRDAMLRAAERRGAEIRAGTASIVAEGDALRGIDVDGDRLHCDAAVLAPGAWAAASASVPGATGAVRPQRGQILHLDVPTARTGRWPFVTGFHSHYLLTFPERRVVAGATREEGVGFDHRVTAGGAREVLAEALRVAPGLAGSTVVEIRVGFRPMSPDGLAILGPVPGAAGAYMATGLGPSGLTMGPYAGAVAADLALGRTVALDLHPYRPDRFA